MQFIFPDNSSIQFDATQGPNGDRLFVVIGPRDSTKYVQWMDDGTAREFARNLIETAQAILVEQAPEPLYRKCPDCNGTGLDENEPCANVTTGPYGGVCVHGECPRCEGGKYIPA